METRSRILEQRFHSIQEKKVSDYHSITLFSVTIFVLLSVLANLLEFTVLVDFIMQSEEDQVSEVLLSVAGFLICHSLSLILRERVALARARREHHCQVRKMVWSYHQFFV